MTDLKELPIAFYCLNDPLDKTSWSGIPYYIGKALEEHVGKVDHLGPVKVPWLLEKTMRGLMKLSRFFFSKNYLPQYSILKNIFASRYLQNKMKGKSYSFIFAPAAASELAFLKTKTPIIYFGDATFKAYSEAYVNVFSKVSTLSKLEGEWLERRSLKKSVLCVFTSHWAADSAISDYDVTKKKIEVMLMGANVDHAPPREIIFRKKDNKTLTLLFLAVDWERKGGAIAFEALVHLCKRGIKVKLIICGCIPPARYRHEHLEIIPFIDKNQSKDYALFDHLLLTSHFLLLPTRADCSLLVAMEANSYGVPAITTKVGGVPDVVKDGINGYCLNREAAGSAYADLILEVYLDKPRYQNLVASSRDRYDQVLNWDRWAQEFKTALVKHGIPTL